MTRNFIASVIKHERVVTTLEKAKAMKSAVEKVITLGKKKDLARYRNALARVGDEAAVTKLFGELGPRYADRPGGYTRIVRLSDYRKGDGGSKVIFELVDNKILEQQLAAAAIEEE